jgi:hypothetical protein
MERQYGSLLFAIIIIHRHCTSSEARWHLVAYGGPKLCPKLIKNQ